MVNSICKEHSQTSAISFCLTVQAEEARKEKGKVCFGSGLERKTLYSGTHGMVSRHARQYMRENLDIAPGLYEPSSSTLAFGSLLNKPTSKLGTVLGGRKAERKFFVTELTPAPGEYNIPETFPHEFRQAHVPFNSTTCRTKTTTNYPGVGTYKVNMYKRRTTAFKHSFGGKKCLLPNVKIKCGPFNFDKCERCQKYPEGDYWYLEPIVEEVVSKKMKQSDIFFLCRPCYDIEKKENQFFTKAQFQRFKKIRDCSKIHMHDGCKGKLFIVPPKEIEKLKEREGYLSLYFN